MRSWCISRSSQETASENLLHGGIEVLVGYHKVHPPLLEHSSVHLSDARCQGVGMEVAGYTWLRLGSLLTKEVWHPHLPLCGHCGARPASIEKPD